LGPRERREREREEIRTKILDAARELFVAEGYEAVTMRRIADRIEYSPTAIYFHFRDKETLLREICDADFLTLAHEIAVVAQIADPIERLRAIGLAYFRFGMNYPNHYRLMFMTPHPPLGDDHEIERGNPEEDAYALLKSIVAQAIAEGKFQEGITDVDLAAQTVWAGMHGVIALQIAKGNDNWVDWRPLEQRAELMNETLLNGLLRHGR
jgi:AcrR family transcriptional regulator